jgi:hypothetical protein
MVWASNASLSNAAEVHFPDPASVSVAGDTSSYVAPTVSVSTCEESFWQVRVAVTLLLSAAHVYVTSLQLWSVAGIVSVLVWTVKASLSNAAEVHVPSPSVVQLAGVVTA